MADHAGLSEQEHDLLHFAYADSEVSRMQPLLEQGGVNVNVRGDGGCTALHLACYSNNLEVVRLLLAYGADIHIKDKDGKTPLNTACFSSYVSTERIQFLIDNGADVNTIDNQGKTPLHWACWIGLLEIADLLIQNGADLRAKDKDGMTPLNTACFIGRFELVRLLLNHSANLNAKDNGGKTPLHTACDWDHSEDWETVYRMDSGVRHLEVVKVLLLESGTNGNEMNAQDNDGNTPFHLAYKRRHWEVMELLLSKGASIDIETVQGRRILDVACRENHIGIVRWMLHHRQWR